MDTYNKCFVECHKSCQAEGLGSTFCEMRCDGECMAQETAAWSTIMKLKVPRIPPFAPQPTGY
ncbi:hypothetical protein ACJRO7_032005 [Eucalyptus globulus]|uniref:Uncharacterized protein n=1 Tax=Eucalyptus globulus TaxID=34317 RepID=A0ABD3JJC8_EUCGL